MPVNTCNTSRQSCFHTQKWGCMVHLRILDSNHCKICSRIALAWSLAKQNIYTCCMIPHLLSHLPRKTILTYAPIRYKSSEYSPFRCLLFPKTRYVCLNDLMLQQQSKQRYTIIECNDTHSWFIQKSVIHTLTLTCFARYMMPVINVCRKQQLSQINETKRHWYYRLIYWVPKK